MASDRSRPGDWILWGSELSPFALKLEALLRYSQRPFHWLPAEGDFREALPFEWRRHRLVSGRLPLTWPEMTPLDEFPLVPFLFGPDGENLYDSSAIADWLDQHGPTAGSPLVPSGDPAVGFAIRLLDEAFDEVGLYLVHHNRWVVSARDNDAGARLAQEMRPLMGPLAALLRRRFPARQVRRLPYLFSVAPAQDRRFEDLPPRLRPPTRHGFPPTHALLERMFTDLLAAVEPVLATRPYLFGARFTLADASLYGQLGMNRKDPAAWSWIGRIAPATQAWVDTLARGSFAGHRPKEPLSLAGLEPLLRWTCDAFVPLMQQNLDAWERHRRAGAVRFNEAAFNRGECLYDGTLLGQPFRSVAKTFQVRVWQGLRAGWDRLPETARGTLEKSLPAGHGLDRDGLGVS